MMRYALALLGLLATPSAAFSPAAAPRLRSVRAVETARRLGASPVAVVIDISSADEFNDALESAGDSLVVVDYSTSWCGPCKIIAPKFDEFSETYKNVAFLKVHTAPHRSALCSASPAHAAPPPTRAPGRSWATAARRPTN